MATENQESKTNELPYDGEYVHGRMSTTRDAEYRFPTGTVYRGTFKNGTFHGKGVLIFKNMGEFRGEWKEGELLNGDYTHQDGLSHTETAAWYCTEKDRRFYGEHLKGVPPAGKSVIRCENREGRPIPKGTFDVNDGYYSATTGNVHDYQTGKVVRTPTDAQKEVITSRAYTQR